MKEKNTNTHKHSWIWDKYSESKLSTKFLTGPNSSYVQVADAHDPIHFSCSLFFWLGGQCESSTTSRWFICGNVCIHVYDSCCTPSPHSAEHFDRWISHLFTNQKFTLIQMTIFIAIAWICIFFLQFRHFDCPISLQTKY